MLGYEHTDRLVKRWRIQEELTIKEL
jgi:hypothetical protein